MCIVRCDRYPTEKSSTTMPATIWSHTGQCSCAIRPAGRNVSAAVAAIDARSQLDTNDVAVSHRFAVRRPCLHDPVTNIGTAVSISAPMAITDTMMATLFRKSRALMNTSRQVILEVASSATTDEYLIFLSGSSAASAVSHNER